VGTAEEWAAVGVNKLNDVNIGKTPEHDPKP